MNVNEATRRYLDSLLVEERLIDAVLPSPTVTFFGEKFATPVMTPAFSHLNALGEGRENALVEYSRAAKEADALNWVGMVTDEAFAEIAATGARTVRIIKPFADHNRIAAEIAFAQEHGAAAAGIDIDHVFGDNGAYDVVDGIEMGPVSAWDLRAFAAGTSLPLVVKGVLSVADAVKCAENGVKGIVVSHHHGRMAAAVPPLMVLPAIRDALKGSGVQIFADCHMDSGLDVFRALALGADGASLGRSLLAPLKQLGTAGALEKIHQTTRELVTVMGYAGIPSVADMDRSVIHPMPFLP